MRVILRPSTAEDWKQLRPETLPCRIRAITAEIDGKLLGIGGIGYRPEGTIVAFAVVTDEGRRYPAAVHRAGLAAMKMIQELGLPRVIADAQPGNPAAERWLIRLGFEKMGDTFVWTRGGQPRANR